MRRLESLEAWRAARQLAAMAYRLTLEPPLSRHFPLVDQIRRAAPSVPANVAEGLRPSHQAAVRSLSPHRPRLSYGASDAPRAGSGAGTVCPAQAGRGGAAAM